MDFEIGRRIAAATCEPRSTTFLRQRISVAVQRENVYCVQGLCGQSATSVAILIASVNIIILFIKAYVGVSDILKLLVVYLEAEHTVQWRKETGK